MNLQLAGLFLKRTCIFGTPVPGRTSGSTVVPKACDTEPTLVLVALVTGAVLFTIVAFVAAVVLVAMRPRKQASAAAAPEPVAQERQDAVQEDRWRDWRGVYVRLLAFVGSAMTDVGRVMPDEHSVPSRPPPRFENEESGRLAAELAVLGSSSVQSAHAAWSHTLFRFYLLARDVAEAGAQNLPHEEYQSEVVELQKTRSGLYEMAESLREQAVAELVR